MQFRHGLNLDDREEILSSLTACSSGNKAFIAPKYCDQTHYTLPTGDQGETPSCVGQAFAANVEAWRWAEQDIYEQINGFELYNKAKAIEGTRTIGTTLLCGAKAAAELHGLNGRKLHVLDMTMARYAIHRCHGFVGAFNAREDWAGQEIMVGKENSPILGPHAVWCCGYDENTLWFQNSWTQKHGFFGFHRIPWPFFKRDFHYGLAIDMRGEK